MTTEEPETRHTVIVVEELHLSDPGLTGYVKAKPRGDDWCEFHAAVEPGLEDADREGTLDWIMANIEQFIVIGPERAGWFAIDDDPTNGWHAYARTVVLPSMAFLAEVDLGGPESALLD